MNSTLEQIRFLHATIELCKEEIHDDLVDGNRAVKYIFLIEIHILQMHITHQP